MRRIPLLLLAAFLLAGAGPAGECPMPNAAVDVAQLYETLSTNAELVAPGPTSASRHRPSAKPETSVATLPVANFIDTHIGAKLQTARISPTRRSTDEEFLRRVSLDLTGAIPDAAAVTAFVNDPSPTKRAKKIDELLASDAYVDRWTLWFGDLVQNVQVSNNIRMFPQGRNAYYSWIRESFRSGKPYDQMVRELVTGRGDNFTSGVANYVVRQLQRNGPPQDTFDNLAAHAGEKFLAMPLLCISCHSGIGHLEQVNTYLAKKQRVDFWKMAAFFSKTTARASLADPANPNVRKYDVQDSNVNGRYSLNTTDGNKSPRNPLSDGTSTVAPAFLTTGEAPAANENSRDAFARMLTSDRQFARATVNYLWKEMFGLGIVEPVNSFDLIKLSTQASHPELLEELTTSFISSNYDFSALLRTMANSNAYQLAAEYTPGNWNEAWVPYFARRYPRRLLAEMLFDAVVKATAVPITINIQQLGPVSKAMAIPDPTEPGARQALGLFLNGFGRGDRDETLRTNDAAITQALSMMNDPLVTNRLRRATPNSTVAKTLAATSDPGTIAEQLYLATLSRRPTATERQQAIDFLRGGTLNARTEDLQFALVNSLEFLFN
ncbi:MAG TPA: DUF1549 domain-containing protein [Thermoanaerobaculia bacterium]|jgi:hypothetical protein